MSMSVRTRNSKTIAPIDLIFFTEEVLYPLPGPPLRLSGFGSGLENLFEDSSPLGDRTKYIIKVRHDIKRVSYRARVCHP